MNHTDINTARRAYLLAILGRAKEYHRNYIAEKVDFAFLVKEPWMLRQQLDSHNQRTFDDLLEVSGEPKVTSTSTSDSSLAT